MTLTTAETGILAGTISLVDGQGSFVKADGDADIDDIAITVDGTDYYSDLTLKSDTIAGFYRAFWRVYSDEPATVPIVIEEEFFPEDIRAHAAEPFTEELVPLLYLTEIFLENIDTQTYSKDGMRDLLDAARAELEEETQMFFTNRVIVEEKHDWFLGHFRQEFWMQQVRHWPLRSVEKMVIKYNDQEIADLDLSWIKFEPDLGIIEILPYAEGESGYLWSVLMNGLSGLGISIFGGLYDRIPAFFHLDYTAGLDFFNMDIMEQNNFRHAICRRAAIHLLPKLDPKMGISSESAGIDGVTQSTSYTASAMYGQHSAQIEQYKKEDTVWVEKIRRRYAKDLIMSVA